MRTVNIDGRDEPMCCHGCQAVARAIVDSGNADFYRHRTEISPTGQETVPDFIRQTQVYDHPAVQKTFVRHEDEHLREAARNAPWIEIGPQQEPKKSS